MVKYTDFNPQTIRLIEPENDNLVYCGRIDDEDRTAPVFVMPGSFVRVTFSGSSWIRAVVVNRRQWGESWVGVLADKKQARVRIERDGMPEVITLAENLSRDELHEVTFFKRMDQCHEYVFLGFLVEYAARIERGRQLSRKKIEFYGDSVTSGEVSEAIAYVGQPDPIHNGEYHNAYFSYAWATARMLHAQAHFVSQGGIALMDGTGYYADGRIGIESCFDKIYFDTQAESAKADADRMKKWNFARYTPHVVVVAIGQNDSFPQDVMKEDYCGEKAQEWREHYKKWILSLRRSYPRAWIVLTTTILYHHPSWDRSIGKVCAEINDPKIVHFLFKETGRGTPGHVRAPEAMNMALELAGFIESLSVQVWEE